MLKPLVSIVMPAYNSASFIRESIGSCLAQSYDPIELIVIDDGSSDDTVAIVQSFGDAVLLIQQANQGPAIARNTGIQQAKGAFIQFCDSDDLLHPEKITKSLAVLQAHPDSALVYSLMQPVDLDGKTPLDMPRAPTPDFFDVRDLFCKILDYNGCPLQTSSLLIRKEALQAVGSYRADPHHRCAEDWDLLLRLANEYEMIGIQEVLTYYRVHSASLSRNPLLMAEGRLQTIRYAREYSARQQCYDDKTFLQLEGGRVHNLAMTYWRMNQPKLARQYFLEAIRMTSLGRFKRLMTLLATYMMSPQQFESLLKF